MPKNTTILTGFLGAGKTTHLNHLLKTNPNKRYAIIENEFGEQSIDHALIISTADNIVEMNNGCLCCTLNDNLYDILNALYERRDEFDELIIEATGIADPTGIAEPFINHPAIKKEFPLTNIICLIDAELIEEQLKETEDAIKQIAFSDILLVNKTDLVSAEYIPLLEKILRGLNPLAKVYSGFKENYPNTENIQYNLTPSEYKTETHHNHSTCNHTHHMHTVSNSFPVNKPEAHHHHHQHGEITSHTFTFTTPFNIDVLYNSLYQYLMFQSKDVYRVKGFIYGLDEEHKYILQSVGKRLGLEEGKEWLANERKESSIVFIGKNLKKEGLQKMLQKNLHQV